MRLPSGDYCVGDLYAERSILRFMLMLNTCAPMAALQDTLSLHLLHLYGCIVLDNALLYLSAVVLRVRDAADN